MVEMELKFKYWKRVAISDRFSTSVQRSKEHVGTGEGAVQGQEPGAGRRGNSGPIITSRGPQRPCDSSNIQTGQPPAGLFPGFTAGTCTQHTFHGPSPPGEASGEGKSFKGSTHCSERDSRSSNT